MKEIIPYSLIAKFLSGEATEREMEDLHQWRTESASNEKVFHELKDIWHLSHLDKTDFIFPDKEIVWKRVISGITKPQKTYSGYYLMKVAGIAAIIALFIGLSFSTFDYGNKTIPSQEVFVKAPKGQKSEVILPDGTAIWLNAGSTLSYYSDYNYKNRTVKLQGEAFFDVKKNDKLAFNVVSGDIKVVVHGTSFNINAYEHEDMVDIALLKGSVSVESTSEEKLLANLRPNEMVRVNKRTMDSELKPCDAELESIWRYGNLRIEDEPIERVIKKIEHWYGVNIEVKGNFSQEHYWFTITTESLKETLDLINKITPINYNIKGEEVQITYR